MSNIKTLIVLLGNARGGERTWETMYDNLLSPYNADLALCFGKTGKKVASLYHRAKYIWEISEYNNWKQYYKTFMDDSGYWEKSFISGATTGLAGGLDQYIGSGAIIFALRHFLKFNYLDIINQYDRIILTRSDYFYIQQHPILDNNHIWIVEGEDYGGITDRHHIFPTKYASQMLGVIDYMNTEIGYDQISKYHKPNPEVVLKLSFQYFNIQSLIQRFPRCQFTVAIDADTTRWQPKTRLLPNEDNIYIKYISEYQQAIRNVKHI